MGNLVLGPVVFRGYEIPERIRFGGRQRLTVHRLAGGGRVVDVMGDEDAPVTWSGVFTGPDAAVRVRVLEQLRRSGDVLPLAWEAWRYSVVLEEFDVEGSNPAWLPYRIRACVVESADAVLPAVTAFAFTLAEAAALGAGPGLDERIGVASAALVGEDVAEAIAAAGSLAQLVTARAILGNIP